jgi:hypothetical protein
MNFNKKLCPSMYAIDTKMKKLIPTAVVLKSARKFATVASTLAKTSRVNRINTNPENRRLDWIK